MAIGWIKARCLHVKSIGKPWWLLVEGAWAAFWTADAVIAKYGSKHVKDVWDKYTLHVFFDWKTGVIGLLAITLLLVIEGSFRHARKLGASDTIAEEDPRVWLKPLNAEYLSNGFMPFEISNRGQRVNPAQGIKIQPIPCVPSVHFDYVDCLDMDERKRVVPIVDDGIGERHDILPELEKAWKASWEDGTGDPERVDLEFQIRINYRDFHPRYFETTVTMKYFPLEMQAFSRDVPAGKHREYTFLKVTDTAFKRLS